MTSTTSVTSSTATGTISLSGLLGGTAGSIDVPSLISSLMSAASVPQTQLKDQQTAVEKQLTAYRNINAQLTEVQIAAQKVSGASLWKSKAVTSSNASVAASSSTLASAGSTTFDVVKLAAAQVSTVAVASDGTAVTDPSAGITITGGDGTSHAIALTSGSASSVAAAINSAAVGVRASVVTTDNGTILQLSSSKTGTANGFTAAGFDSPPATVTDASNAQIKVGGSNGYTVSSSSNTFTGAIAGVTFSVSAVASGVTLAVTNDTSTISSAIQSLVDNANSTRSTLATDTAQGGTLSGSSDATALITALGSSVSAGVNGGGSLKTYGIDIDSSGTISFDADAFAAAYAADPAGTQSALSGAFATSLKNTTTSAIDPSSGSINLAIASLSTTDTNLTNSIADWTTRLSDEQTSLTTKFTAMETALAKLQSQQSYLTSMFNSVNGTSSSSSS